MLQGGWKEWDRKEWDKVGKNGTKLERMGQLLCCENVLERMGQVFSPPAFLSYLSQKFSV